MKREEALKDLKHFRDHVYWDGMASESLDMAIEALEQQKEGHWIKQMTNKDAIENLKMIHFSFINPSTEEQRHLITDTFEVAIEALKKQRAKGHWIYAKVGKLFPSNDFKCSECGNILDFNGVNCGRGNANYCPNCGADMRGD